MGLFLILKGVYTMNKTRRKELGAAIDVLWDAEAFIEGVKEEEEEYLARMPENLRDGGRGATESSKIDAMHKAMEYIEAAIEKIRYAQK